MPDDEEWRRPEAPSPAGCFLGLVVGVLVCIGFGLILYSLVWLVGVPMMERSQERFTPFLAGLGGALCILVAIGINRGLNDC